MLAIDSSCDSSLIPTCNSLHKRHLQAGTKMVPITGWLHSRIRKPVLASNNCKL
jgi:hypothetical protein